MQENNSYSKGGKLIKRADGSYSRRGLWDNIRANKGSGKKPTKQMLEQERKIKAKYPDGGNVKTVSKPKFPVNLDTRMPSDNTKSNVIFPSNVNDTRTSFKDDLESALAIGSLAAPFPLSYGLGLAGSTIDLYDAYNADTPRERNNQLAEAALGAIPYGRIVKGAKAGTDFYKAYKSLRGLNTLNKGVDVKDAVDPSLQYADGGKVKPIVVTNPNDPRLKAYQDSSALYNSSVNLKNTLDKLGYYQNENAYNPDFQTSYGKEEFISGIKREPYINDTTNVNILNYPHGYNLAGGNAYDPRIPNVLGHNKILPIKTEAYLPNTDYGSNYQSVDNGLFRGSDGVVRTFKEVLNNPNLYSGNTKTGEIVKESPLKNRVTLPIYQKPVNEVVLKDNTYGKYYGNHNSGINGYYYMNHKTGKMYSPLEYKKLMESNMESPVKKQFANGGTFLTVGGEYHRVYKNADGDIIVNHPKEDKGKWDTINLTDKSNAKTVAQGVAATKKWHRENPYADGGILEENTNMEYGKGGYTVKRSSDRKGKTHVVIGPDGTKKYFGDPNLGEKGKSKYGKEAFYARHKKNLANNPYFRAYARKTWEEGGMIPEEGHITMNRKRSLFTYGGLTVTDLNKYEEAGVVGSATGATVGNLANGMNAVGMVTPMVESLIPDKQYTDSEGNDLGSRKSVGESALSSAASGAALGSMFGPIGTIAGGALGAGYGAITGWMEKDEMEKKQKEAETRIRNKNLYKQMNTNVNWGNPGINTSQEMQFAEGGMYLNQDDPNANAELELQETFQLPNGQVGMVDGPSHEQGGIQVDLPEGTRIWSDKLKYGGKTFAKHTKPITSKIAKLEKQIEDNPINSDAKKNTVMLLNKQLDHYFDVQETNKEVNEMKRTFKKGGMIKKYQDGDTVGNPNRVAIGAMNPRTNKPYTMDDVTAYTKSDFDLFPIPFGKQYGGGNKDYDIPGLGSSYNTNIGNYEQAALPSNLPLGYSPKVNYAQSTLTPTPLKDKVRFEPPTEFQPYIDTIEEVTPYAEMQTNLVPKRIGQGNYGQFVTPQVQNPAVVPFDQLPIGVTRPNTNLNLGQFGVNANRYIAPENLTMADIGKATPGKTSEGFFNKAGQFIQDNPGLVGQLGSALATAGIQSGRVNSLARPRTLGQVRLSDKVVNPNLVDYSAERQAYNRMGLNAMGEAQRGFGSSAAAQAFKNKARLNTLEGTGKSWQSQENANAQILNAANIARQEAAMREAMMNNEIEKYNLENVYGYDTMTTAQKNAITAMLGNTAGQTFGKQSDYKNQLAQANIMANMSDRTVLRDTIRGNKELADAMLKAGKIDQNMYNDALGIKAYGGMMKRSFRKGGINNPGFKALPEEVQKNIMTHMSMGGKLMYDNMYAESGKLPKNILKSRLEAHMSPEDVDSYLSEYAKGGIHINPKNKGKFTAYAKSHGKGVQEMAATVLANKENYSPTIVKRANFARNAKKFKH